MSNLNIDLDADLNLDEEEQEILDWVDREEWEPVPDSAEKIEQLQQSAKAFLDKKREYPILITYDELVEAQEILSVQLHGGGYLPKTAQTIKSLLDKIEAAIQNRSLAN